MESVNVSSIISKSLQTFHLKHAKERVIVGHNSHPLAAKLARLWIQQLIENYQSTCCYIELSTPAICRYACAVMRASRGYWLQVRADGELLAVEIVVLYQNGMEEVFTLFEGIHVHFISALSAETVSELEFEHAPEFFTKYLDAILNSCMSVRSIRRARIRLAVGFDDSFHARYVTRFLSSLGCKVIPVFQTNLLPDELARTVIARHLSFGVILDECLNIRSFVTESGLPVVTTGDTDIQGALIRSILLGYSNHSGVQLAVQKNISMDSMMILLEILKWLSVIDAPISHYLQTYLQHSVMEQQESSGDSGIMERLASFQKSRDQ
jgi:hypothetical protein